MRTGLGEVSLGGCREVAGRSVEGRGVCQGLGELCFPDWPVMEQGPLWAQPSSSPSWLGRGEHRRHLAGLLLSQRDPWVSLGAAWAGAQRQQ